MKTTSLLIVLFLYFTSCSPKEEKRFQTPEKITIAGKVRNLNPNKLKVKFDVNRPGFAQTNIEAKTDSLGNFSATFESYTPTDVWLLYKMNFLVLVHPGDSIYVEFDGKPRRRPAILKSIKFSGDAAQTNHDAAIFQRMYFSNAIYADWKAKKRAIKEYDAEAYMHYLDTMQQKSKTLYEKFLAEATPNEEAKNWASVYLRQHYFDALAFYPLDHQLANKLTNDEWRVPVSYYDPLLKGLPVTEKRFISGYALSNFVNRFHYDYARVNLWNEEANQKYVYPNGFAGPTEIMDSINLFGLIKHTPDTLLRQMVLTEMFSQDFRKSDINVFQKYRHVAEAYIQEPFLREPLFGLYHEVKSRLENPEVATDAILKEVKNSSVSQIMDSILTNSKGKVIYLDVWATWCGPCLAEMPYSKALMEQLKNQDVSFIYVCLESEENKWKALIDKYKLGGQHYFLSAEQSADLRKAFKIQGIPYYLLIDKKGTITDKGSHLRPSNVTGKIIDLVK